MATAEFDATGASTPATISFVFIEKALIADFLHHRINLLINQLDLGPEPPIFRRRRFGAQKIEQFVGIEEYVAENIQNLFVNRHPHPGEEIPITKRRCQGSHLFCL